MLFKFFGRKKGSNSLRINTAKYKDVGEVNEETSLLIEKISKSPSRKMVERAIVKLAKMDWFQNLEDTEGLSFALLASGEKFLSKEEREFVAAVHSLSMEMLLAKEGVLL